MLLAILAMLLSGCSKLERTRSGSKNAALAAQIRGLLEAFISSDDESKEARVLAEAKTIFEREGIPSSTRVGDDASYGFVLVNMLGQPQSFRTEFIKKVREANANGELPPDAAVFAEARLRQTEVEERFRNRLPLAPAMRDEIFRLHKIDQAVRQKEGFDAKKMEKVDSEIRGPLQAIFERHGVPTYDMVGVEAAEGFVVMVQHQSPEFRRIALPKLKANVDAGQGDAGTYAMVYDRAQRDRGKKQLYGEQLECQEGKTLSEAPIEEEATVNMRRAGLGLIRVQIYARLVKLRSPDLCGSAPP